MELANKYFKNSYYNQEENVNTKKREMKYIKKDSSETLGTKKI